MKPDKYQSDLLHFILTNSFLLKTSSSGIINGFFILSFHLLLSAAGAAGVLCRAKEAASFHADDLQFYNAFKDH